MSIGIRFFYRKVCEFFGFKGIFGSFNIYLSKMLVMCVGKVWKELVECLGGSKKIDKVWVFKKKYSWGKR